MDKKFNSTKHGLLQKKIQLMQGESRYLYRKLNSSLFEHWQPGDLAESILVQELVYNHWRLKRAYKLEGEFLQKAKNDADRFKVFAVEWLDLKDFDRFARYITSIQRQIIRNLHELERLQVSRKGQNSPIQPVLDVSVDIPNG